MKFENVLTAFVMVIIGGVALWFVFGPVVLNAINAVVSAL